MPLSDKGYRSPCAAVWGTMGGLVDSPNPNADPTGRCNRRRPDGTSPCKAVSALRQVLSGGAEGEARSGAGIGCPSIPARLALRSGVPDIGRLCRSRCAPPEISFQVRATQGLTRSVAPASGVGGHAVSLGLNRRMETRAAARSPGRIRKATLRLGRSRPARQPRLCH